MSKIATIIRILILLLSSLTVIASYLLHSPPILNQPVSHCIFAGTNVSLSFSVPDEFSGFHKELLLSLHADKPTDLTVALSDPGPGVSWFFDPWEIRRLLDRGSTKVLSVEPVFPDLEGPEGGSFSTVSVAKFHVFTQGETVSITLPIQGRYFIPHLTDEKPTSIGPLLPYNGVSRFLRCSRFQCSDFGVSDANGNLISGEHHPMPPRGPVLCVPMLAFTRTTYAGLVLALTIFMCISIYPLIKSLLHTSS